MCLLRNCENYRYVDEKQEFFYFGKSFKFIAIYSKIGSNKLVIEKREVRRNEISIIIKIIEILQ